MDVSDPSSGLSMSGHAFADLFAALSNWGRWGQGDEKGALNYITASHVRRAVQGVRSGRTFGLGLPLDTVAGPDNPNPAVHRMTQLPEPSMGRATAFSCDSIGVEFHGDAHSHLDALCHVVFRGELYNGIAARSVTEAGASHLGVEALRDGIVGRGVLLDIPVTRRTAWLEPGDAVTTDDLEAAEGLHGVRLGQGDILLCRTGHYRRRREHGPWDAAKAKAGFDPRAMEWVHERGVAAIGSDGDSDTVPSLVDGVDYPVHVLAICAMGMVLMDSLKLDDLAQACEDEGRWDFLLMVAPLVLNLGTGSPVNPIAVF
jgi:kynurenine formamidase